MDEKTYAAQLDDLLKKIANAKSNSEVEKLSDKAFAMAENAFSKGIIGEQLMLDRLAISESSKNRLAQLLTMKRAAKTGSRGATGTLAEPDKADESSPDSDPDSDPDSSGSDYQHKTGPR